jgi:hypothetical protein
MPKQVKGLAGRKPPALSSDHSGIDAWMTQLMPRIQPLAAALDEAICRALPDAEYAVKRMRAHYGLPALGCVIELAAYHVSVNVLFYGGADFNPPPPLGETDRTRYVKLTSLDEIGRPDLNDWIRQAGLIEGWT